MRPLVISLVFMCVASAAVFSQSKNVLQLHPRNPHYFIYQNKPMIIIGSGEHYGAVVNLDFDYKKYLEALSASGLNNTRLFAGAYVEKAGDFGIMKNTLAPAPNRLILPWRRSSVAGYALGGNKFDLNQWDEAYFVRLKDFMAEASRRGIIVEVTLFSAHYGGGWNYSALNHKNNVNLTDSVQSALVNTLENGNVIRHQEKYVRKVVRELNMFDNLYFEVQNEPWADQNDLVLKRNEYGDAKDWRTTLQVVSQRSNEWQRKVAGWIRDEESKLANKHLISQNIGNFHYPVTDADPNISIFNFHYALPEAVAENYHLDRVIGFNETGFAGRADATYSRQAWRFLMAGGALFSQLDYSFSAGAELGQDTTYKAPGGGSPELRRRLAVLKRFFEGLNFIDLKPDHNLVTAAPGASTQAMSDGKTQWVIYVEPMATKTYDLTLNLPKGNYQAAWMDAVTGQSLQTTTVSSGKLQVTAGMNDKVVTISKAPKKS